MVHESPIALAVVGGFLFCLLGTIIDLSKIYERATMSLTFNIIVSIIFFAGTAWIHLGEHPDWVRVVTGVAAALMAIAALVQVV